MLLRDIRACKTSIKLGIKNYSNFTSNEYFLHCDDATLYLVS